MRGPAAGWWGLTGTQWELVRLGLVTEVSGPLSSSWAAALSQLSSSSWFGGTGEAPPTGSGGLKGWRAAWKADLESDPEAWFHNLHMRADGGLTSMKTSL